MSRTQVALLIPIVVLLAVNIAILVSAVRHDRQMLEVSFLDVGQGDAILIESPTGVQILVDGGRDRSVLRELGKQMDLLDRTLDVVIATHPDADHISGLAHVLERYHVAGYMAPGVESDSSPSRALQDSVEREASLVIPVRRGERVYIGGGAYIDILFPDRDVPDVETNTGSVVMRLVYGETSFFLSGDAPESVEDYLVSLDGKTLSSDIVKAGHHGSRTSTGPALLQATDPKYVIVSAGEGNSYGHPHQEVLDRIQEMGAGVLSTLGKGTIVVESDGKILRARQ